METISGEQFQVHLEDHSATHRGKALQPSGRSKSYFSLKFPASPRANFGGCKILFRIHFAAPMKVLLVHNSYQLHGGEDVAFEQECSCSEDIAIR